MCAPPLTFHYVHAIQSEHIPNTSDVLDFSRETRCVVVSSRSVHVAVARHVYIHAAIFPGVFDNPTSLQLRPMGRTLDWDSI
ncbi:hypothetical protein B0H14DRAFT_3440332 [Mycena olivaceomarginata]|nr:hypothetical protein B0H14DRAFT_3534153 [Mycena olivaceomarginata]KAJ7870110.1 hypothetical protein B0H14DRAFT_3440332 [Mycena olivaceomarginata]